RPASQGSAPRCCWRTCCLEGETSLDFGMRNSDRGIEDETRSRRGLKSSSSFRDPNSAFRNPNRSEPLALVRYLVLILERSFLEFLDMALIVVRKRPLALGAAAAAGAAPFAAWYAWMAADKDSWRITLLLFLAMAAPWATAPLTVVL